jgi:hypothetical protein
VFKNKTAEEKAAEDAQRERDQAWKEQQRRQAAAEKERAAFLASPVGQAETGFARGDQVFQYSHSVMSQQAIIVAMVGSNTSKTTTDPSEILNAVCRQGWELVNGSFVFVVEGEQSRDKFMASGQNVAVKGQTVGYYLFRRCADNHVVNDT